MRRLILADHVIPGRRSSIVEVEPGEKAVTLTIDGTPYRLGPDEARDLALALLAGALESGCRTDHVNLEPDDKSAGVT